MPTNLGRASSRRGCAALLMTAAAVVLALRAPAYAADTLQSETPAAFVPRVESFDYVKREVLIPMRDGVKLQTVILIPRGAHRTPILLSRTPYGATDRIAKSASAHLSALIDSNDVADDAVLNGGYIRVMQDVRGKHGSEGGYIMTRPLRGPLNSSAVDHSTDAYDTIDWLIKNVRETNGRVGMQGSSYEGFTVLMALVHPHPALKVAIPMCPMVDGWRGDDWFHSGAFRQPNFDYFLGQSSERGEGKGSPRPGYDDYESFRRAGSAGDFARQNGLDQIGVWRKISEHPAYDAYWQGQALDKLLAAEPLTVPTMIVASTWDQEDSYGGVHTYEALEPKDKANDKLYLVLGPWRHSGANSDAASLGPMRFDSDTALAFRRDLARPFFDARLKDRAPVVAIAPVNAYETGTYAWRRLQRTAQVAVPAARRPCRVRHLGHLGHPGDRKLRRVRGGSRQAGALPAAPGAVRRP